MSITLPEFWAALRRMLPLQQGCRRASRLQALSAEL